LNLIQKGKKQTKLKNLIYKETNNAFFSIQKRHPLIYKEKNNAFSLFENVILPKK